MTKERQLRDENFFVRSHTLPQPSSLIAAAWKSPQDMLLRFQVSKLGSEFAYRHTLSYFYVILPSQMCLCMHMAALCETLIEIHSVLTILNHVNNVCTAVSIQE